MPGSMRGDAKAGGIKPQNSVRLPKTMCLL